MNTIEQSQHFRAGLMRFGKPHYHEELLIQLRDLAISALKPSEVPRDDISDDIKKAYAAKGLSTDWNLKTTDAYSFYHAVRKVSVSASQLSAATLLYETARALEDEVITEVGVQRVLDALTGLEIDNARIGKEFKKGRKPNTSSGIRKAIAKLLSKDSKLKNPQLWDAIATKPPRGWSVFDNRAGKYFEGSKAGQNMTYARFCNVCGEERKKIKQ